MLIYEFPAQKFWKNIQKMTVAVHRTSYDEWNIKIHNATAYWSYTDILCRHNIDLCDNIIQLKLIKYIARNVLRYVTLRYATLRYVTLRYVTSRYAMLR